MKDRAPGELEPGLALTRTVAGSRRCRRLLLLILDFFRKIEWCAAPILERPARCIAPEPSRTNANGVGQPALPRHRTVSNPSQTCHTNAPCHNSIRYSVTPPRPRGRRAPAGVPLHRSGPGRYSWGSALGLRLSPGRTAAPLPLSACHGAAKDSGPARTEARASRPRPAQMTQPYKHQQ